MKAAPLDVEVMRREISFLVRKGYQLPVKLVSLLIGNLDGTAVIKAGPLTNS